MRPRWLLGSSGGCNDCTVSGFNKKIRQQPYTGVVCGVLRYLLRLEIGRHFC